MSRFDPPNYSAMSREDILERLLQLETATGVRFETHPRYRLTNAEQTLLGILLACKHVASKEHIYTLMYGMYLDPPELKILDVYICKLRNKLRPLGVNITTVWGRGWFLDTEDRAKVEALRFTADEEVAA